MLNHSYLGSIASAGTEDIVPAPAQANCFVESGADTVVVSSMAALENAVNAAPPGRNILIAPGTYTGGALTFSGNGEEGNPIVIRPQNGLGTVTINSPRWTLANTSSWLVFEKLQITSSRSILMGDHNRISRCKFSNINVNSSLVINTDNDGGARNCRIDHCDFGDFTAAVPAIAIRPGPFVDGTASRVLIDYCYFHDHLQDSPVIDCFAATSWINLARGTNIILDHCLFDNINQTGEYIIVKIGGWITRFCTFDNMGGYLQPRAVANCEFRSNWFEGASHEDFHGFGPNQLVIGNRFVSGINAWVPCGNASFADVLSGAAPINSYAPATGSRYIGNRFDTGQLRLGTFWSGCAAGGQVADLPADDNILESNTRDAGGSAHVTVTTCLNPSHINTTINLTTNEPFTPAVKLTAADVGLNAADPLCP